MSQSTTNVEVSTATFANWLNKTNDLASALNTVVVTANSTLGNTSGNCHVRGYLAANNLVAVANLSGGSIAANGSGLPQISLANLNIVSNTVFVANVFYNAGITVTDPATWSHSNVHTYAANIIFSGAAKLVANGAFGTANQVLSSNGTVMHWRTLNDYAGIDSVTNTSITIVAFANSVKTAYDAAVASTFTGQRTYNANLTANGTHFIISPTTALVANGSTGTSQQVLSSNGTAVYWRTISEGGGGGGPILDSVSNTSTTYAAAANSVKTAYDAAVSPVFTGSRTFNGNLIANGSMLIVKAGTGLQANGSVGAAGDQLVSNGSSVYWTARPTAVSQFTNDSGYITVSSVTWTNLTGKPTVVSAFTNDAAYITSSGRAYPRRSDGTSIDFIYSAQAGQPSYVTGTSDGLNYYVWNPSNFSVNYAASAGAVDWTNVSGRPTNVSSFTNDSAYITTNGRAYPRRADGANVSFDYTANSGTPSKVWGTANGNVFQAYDPSTFSVANAASVPFTGVTGANAVIRHVTTGYTGSGRVFVSTTTPGSPVQGDIWFQI